MASTGIRAAALVLLALGSAIQGCDRSDQGPIRVQVIGEQREIGDPSEGALTPGQAAILADTAQGLVRFDARGEIVPGLSERWTVTDDGLSYIFRLGSSEWANGDKVTAEQVARALRRQIASPSRNSIKDTLGAIDEIVAMTERVIEIRLKAPRPNMLQLLAQPELAIVRDGRGTGPFRIDEDQPENGGTRIVRTMTSDEEETTSESVLIASAEAPQAVQRFLKEETDLVMGGTFDDLPYARTEGIAADALQFDPSIGLFGLIPARSGGIVEDVEVRRLLSQSIDRQALVEAFNVPGLQPRTTMLEPGLDLVVDPVAPGWAGVAIADRREVLADAAESLFGDLDEPPTIRVALPSGPGSQILLDRLTADWGALGIGVERAEAGGRADLELIDRVAPSTTPAWFLRRFRCAEAAVCDEAADELLDSARSAPVMEQRSALLGEAARLMDEAQLFIPIAAPIRWSLVGPRVKGFAGNRFARHTLTGIGQPLARDRAE